MSKEDLMNCLKELRFFQDHLQKALECGTRENISKLILNEDQVTVLYDNDYSFNVDVSCDSACCMLLDVMKAIGDRL